MNKTTKGALAAAAAGVLLLGGAGTLAYWTDTATVIGSDINSGHFKLDSSDCASATWKLDGETEAFDPEADLLIPGDTLTKTCDVTVDLAGAHLTTADFSVTDPAWDSGSDGSLTEELGLTTTITDSLTSAELGTTGVTVADGQTLSVSMEIDWQYNSIADTDGAIDGEDNESNVAPAGLTATLDDLTVVATQLHP